MVKLYFQTFTRKKAFDFYIDEVKRDAHKLLGAYQKLNGEMVGSHLSDYLIGY